MDSRFINPWINPGLTLARMLIFWCVLFLLPVLWEWWHEISDYRQAVRESDSYLRTVEDEITDRWKRYDGGLHELRALLHDYERREQMVSRPEQAWALVPYALEILNQLPA